MRPFKALFLILLLLNSFNSSLFDFILFNKMNKEKSGENLIVSPLSIYQVLSLTANGAKGVTQKEMIEVLRENIENLNENNYEILKTFNRFSTLEIANAVMTKFTPLEDFCAIADKYSAPIEPLESLEQVNKWCNDKTHGKIPKILETLSPDTVMLLLNAIYFKGEWESQFDAKFTKNLTFYNFGIEQKNVETMEQLEHFYYYEDKKVQIISLPFKEDLMSAIIILPNEKMDINTYINYLPLSHDEINTVLSQLERKKVHLQLPKFEVEFSDELNQILIDLGMYDAFSPKDADFSGLREEGGLYISKVIHKTYLKVNENGTEAAGVTVVEVEETAIYDEDSKIYDMKINRPFLFLLKNNLLPEEHNLVFMAKIEKI